VECEGIAPSLIPVKAGARFKTDRRDAGELARCNRASELTAVAAPSPEQEALQDLVRAHEAPRRISSKQDATRASSCRGMDASRKA